MPALTVLLHSDIHAKIHAASAVRQITCGLMRQLQPLSFNVTHYKAQTAQKQLKTLSFSEQLATELTEAASD